MSNRDFCNLLAFKGCSLLMSPNIPIVFRCNLSLWDILCITVPTLHGWNRASQLICMLYIEYPTIYRGLYRWFVWDFFHQQYGDDRLGETTCFCSVFNHGFWRKQHPTIARGLRLRNTISPEMRRAGRYDLLSVQGGVGTIKNPFHV